MAGHGVLFVDASGSCQLKLAPRRLFIPRRDGPILEEQPSQQATFPSATNEPVWQSVGLARHRAFFRLGGYYPPRHGVHLSS